MTTQDFRKQYTSSKVVHTCTVELSKNVFGVVNIYDCSFIEKTWKDNFDDSRFSQFSSNVYTQYFAK